MSKKNYNVFFNLHTVSGIVISVALYIIFFAGSFSFFRNEIGHWQKGELLSKISADKIDTDAILKDLDKEYKLLARDVEIEFETNRKYANVDMNAVKDTIANPKGKEFGDSYSYDIKNSKKEDYDDNHIGHFMYFLHILDIIPSYYRIGRKLAGLVAIFFLFAIITGVVVHWKKMISNFYVFNPKTILKKIWTDAHTALGVIGLPYLIIYAITGTSFGFRLLAELPTLTLFNNDSDLMYDKMYSQQSNDWKMKSDVESLDINPFIKRTQTYWEGFNVKDIKIYNYGGTNMRYKLSGTYDEEKHFFKEASIIYDAHSGRIIKETNLNVLNYSDDLITWDQLHYANFGGVQMKIIYFIFGIISCFVIITGILIWIEARNKKSMTLKQRKYTAKVGHIYLAICLSMLPVTALLFIFGRIANGVLEGHDEFINIFYIITWLLFTLFYSLKKDNYFTNKNSLLLGAIFGFLVPIVNGITSGNWFWEMYINEQYEIFMVDFIWIVVSSISLLFYVKIKPSIKEKSSFTSNPIEG